MAPMRKRSRIEKTGNHLTCSREAPSPAVLDAWIETVELHVGTRLLVRPIRPEDDDVMAAFSAHVSTASERARFHVRRGQLTQAEVFRFRHIDYANEMAFIGIARRDDHEEEVGVARYFVDPSRCSVEFALLAADDWQHRGVGRVLLARMNALAAFVGLDAIHGVTSSANESILRLA